MTDISNMDDVIDVRDVIERYEELEEELNDLRDAKDDAKDEEETDAADNEIQEWKQENESEFESLSELLDDLKDYGGDEQWRSDWYPLTLIRYSYFEDYARELAEDIGAIDSNAGWPNSCIDWEQAAEELQMDYSSTEFDGITYWFRS